MDEIDISKGQSLGTFLVLFFLDNGFFCKKREGKSGSKSCESKRGFSQWTKKSHTQKEQRCSICIVVELLIRIYFFGHNVKRQYILKEVSMFRKKNFSCTIFKQLL